ncbi:flotillin family protein [Chloroflexota bacterium]
MSWGFNVAGPNEAIIVSGRRKPKVAVGSRVFVLPVIQRLQRLSLEVMTLTVETPRVYTKQGVAITVDGVAQVKVNNQDEAIRTAAQQFLGRKREDISQIALQTMEGHLRAILGTLTVEEIYQERDRFASGVTEVASTDMANMGLEIVSFTIKEIRDDQGYLDALGMKRTAEVKRDATIGEAEAARDAEIKSAEAEREGKAARYKADTSIAESERGFSVEKAKYDQEVNARKAEAELAYQLQETKTKQQIREEEIQIEVVERRKLIEVQEQEALRMERELEATVRKPAGAEKYRLETIAQGERSRIIAQVEAEAEAIRMRGTAEADAMRLKAEAWKEYGQAAVIQQLLESLPEVAAAVSQPLSKTDRIVVIGGGGGDGGDTGASRVTRDVTNIIAQLPEVVESLTGIDILGTLKDLRGIKTTEEPSETEAPPASSPEASPAAEDKTQE